jgi:hypothetical protein
MCVRVKVKHRIRGERKKNYYTKEKVRKVYLAAAQT